MIDSPSPAELLDQMSQARAEAQEAYVRKDYGTASERLSLSYRLGWRAREKYLGGGGAWPKEAPWPPPERRLGN